MTRLASDGIIMSFKVAPMNHVWASSYLKFDTSAIKDLGKADDGQAPNPGPAQRILRLLVITAEG